MSKIFTKKYILLFFIFLFTNSIFAQNGSINKIKAQPPFETFEYVNQLISNLNLPEDKVDQLPNENLEINLSFFVSNEGKINNVRVKNDTYELTSYFENAMKNLPNWTSAKINEENKSSREQLNIQLNLKENKIIKATPEIGIQKLHEEFISKFKFTSSNISMLYKLGYDVNNSFKLHISCKFTIESNGKLSNLKIHQDELSFFENQFSEILSQIKWNSATENGKSINSELNLPITIFYTDKTK